MALHQALADKPNYRLAQRSMYNLGDLEIILWEAFSKESFATAQAETKKLKVKRHHLHALMNNDPGGHIPTSCPTPSPNERSPI